MRNKRSKLIFIRTIGLIMIAMVGYVYLTGNDYSKLAGYFIYMSVACSIIPLPTPPYVIGMGKTFDPRVIALLGALGNCIAASFEYYFITWLFSKTELRDKIETNRLFQRFINIFNRAAFISVSFTSFSPIPLDPFYLAAILIRYSFIKYLLAIFIGKYLRYYVLAQLGDSFQIPNQYLIIMLAVLVLLPLIVAIFLKRSQATGFKTKSVI